jgi:hypothetical protein
MIIQAHNFGCNILNSTWFRAQDLELLKNKQSNQFINKVGFEAQHIIRQFLDQNRSSKRIRKNKALLSKVGKHNRKNSNLH